VPYSPEWLNALTDAERQSVAASDFSRSMHSSGGEHVAWLLWSTQENAKPTPLAYRQGSMFFLDCGRGPFAVTAGHVFEQFVKDRAELRVKGCQIGNVGFNREERLIDWGRDRRIDLATFRIAPEEIAEIGKQIVRGTDGRWPSPPNVNEVVFFGGFPGFERIEVAPREFSFGLHSGMVPLTDMTEYQLCSRFNARTNSVTYAGGSGPPQQRSRCRCRSPCSSQQHLLRRRLRRLRVSARRRAVPRCQQ
jgi:hypothetical protein